MIAGQRYGQLLLAITLLFGALAAIAFDSAPTLAAAPCRTFTVDTTERLKFTELDNASGMVASKVNDGVFWTHNDKDPGGAAPNALFAIDADGKRLASVVFDLDPGDSTVPGDFIDLEDIAMGPGPVVNKDYLYLADIGDNPPGDAPPERSNVAVYRFREPSFVPDPLAPQTIVVSEASLEAQRFTYQRFDDPTKTHPRNAEAIFVDPEGGDLYIFEKGTHSLLQLSEGANAELKYSNVYRIPRPKLFFGNGVRTAQVVAYIQHRYDGQPADDGDKITGADISHDGSMIVVRNRLKTFYWHRGPGQSISKVFQNDPVAPCLGPDGTRGESVAILPDGSGFYGLREGSSEPLSPVFKAMIVGFGLIECNGIPATHPDHVGTNGDDTIFGTDGNDVIVALGGNDIIYGGKGRDLICAGSGNDVVDGGGGNDTIFGRAGKDHLIGGFGKDRLYGGINGDIIDAGSGDDLAAGGEHADTVNGQQGVDAVRGDRGNDVMRGGALDDVLKGAGGNDTLFGGSGDDNCDGGSGVDSASSCETGSRIP